jgi:tetratricopeptide (TPR) repeat protein
MIFQARELSKARRYGEARVLFEAASEIEPWSRETLLGLAELDYRAGLYRDALGRVNRALQLDAYDAEGNFLAGTIYRALNRPADARDALGWAARSTAHRSAAYAQLAELMVGAGDLDEAVRYARLAIDYDRHSVPGWRSLAVAGRLSGDGALAREARAELLELDPLHHFVRAEGFLGAPERASALALTDALGGEYPQQTLLELALHYVGLGLREDARALLDLTDGPAAEPVIRAWNALLSGDAEFVQEPGDLDFAFPYRRETLGVLQWATERSAHWGWRYLLALNLWAVDRPDEAASLLHDLGDRPDLAAFYVARAFLAHRVGGREPIADLRRAVALEPGTRVLHVYLARQLQDLERWAESLTALEVARSRFPEDFNLALLQARTLVRLDRADEATALLATIEVLPSEHARESHRIYEQAHTLVAMGALERNTWGRGGPTSPRSGSSGTFSGEPKPSAETRRRPQWPSPTWSTPRRESRSASSAGKPRRQTRTRNVHPGALEPHGWTFWPWPPWAPSGASTPSRAWPGPETSRQARTRRACSRSGRPVASPRPSPGLSWTAPMRRVRPWPWRRSSLSFSPTSRAS